MPWENIGSCGTGQIPGDRKWIIQCYEMALSYLKFLMGDPPEGCEIGIMWHEHELGDYPSIGLHWEYPHTDAPWDLINKYETVLERFNEAIDWSAIEPDTIYEELELDDEYE